MIGPKLLADVRQFEPHIHKNSLAMTRFDQLAEIRVVLLVRLEVMPARDVQCRDSGLAPARRKVVEIHAAAIRGIEKSPQALRANRRARAQIVQRLRQIRKALVALDTRRNGDPEDCAGATM